MKARISLKLRFDKVKSYYFRPYPDRSPIWFYYLFKFLDISYFISFNLINNNEIKGEPSK